MDSAKQAAGEKRVRKYLIEPLARRGLAKPTSLTKKQFEEMTQDVCARLAYMTQEGLEALEEQLAAHPGGKDKDRVPIGTRILSEAADIEPPRDDASPLLRKVFAAPVGQEAINAGWAPELLLELKDNRKWPGAWTIKCARERADNAMRRLDDIECRLNRGDDLTPEEEQFRKRRHAAIDKCRRIAALSQAGGGA